MEFEIDDYKSSNGKRYTVEFMRELKKKNSDLWVKTVAQIRKMRFRDYHRLPHSRPMGDGLYEIRTKQGTDISRIFYCLGRGRRIYLLRGFIKKGQKTPNEELVKARKLLNECKQRERDIYGKN